MLHSSTSKVRDMFVTKPWLKSIMEAKGGPEDEIQ